ncbi:MAG: hypothetical protein CBB71_21250 [Rhodopirellula sp. TMED11]|nr:MAG: hypothetical protein CBB71_21250 [Rhodopirellula sp. TMED11]
MSGQYHGWDEEPDKEHFRFAETVGRPKNASVFLIEDFGANTSPRQALSAVVAAMSQFEERVEVMKSDCNDRLILKLKQSAMLRVAEIHDGDGTHWGILGVRASAPKKKRFRWKFWAS